jgi:pyruvate,orthophosphate dikinase
MLVAVVDGSCTLPPSRIGGKAWGVNRMRAIGLRVPPAIVATTDACHLYYAHGHIVPDTLWAQIVEHMQVLEIGTGRRFGATQRPLLVSVRSGAPVSMPGMMDTILDLGINADIEAALASESGDAAYARDTHRRFLHQYARIVLDEREERVPSDPWLQLRGAVAAVFDSWLSPRAQVYRRNRGFGDDACTAVMIQAMVFGNLDEHSGTGVLFSRNPMTGEPPAWGEWLSRAQGEDVVSGQHTPRPLNALREQMPEVHAELLRGAAALEADARDIEDIEFTVESGRLWFLQSRVAKRSPQAALHAAVAFAEEGLISREEALRRTQARCANCPSSSLPRARHSSARLRWASRRVPASRAAWLWPIPRKPRRGRAAAMTSSSRVRRRARRTCQASSPPLA